MALTTSRRLGSSGCFGLVPSGRSLISIMEPFRAFFAEIPD